MQIEWTLGSAVIVSSSKSDRRIPKCCDAAPNASGAPGHPLTDISDNNGPLRPVANIGTAAYHAILVALTLCTLLIHGYHPLAEDGGLYATGILTCLDGSLFAHDLPFAFATRHYSVFAPLMAQLVRTLHLPLAWLLLLVDLAGTWLMLYAGGRIAAQCVRSSFARLCSVALMAAWFTLPVAGTSLLLMDPYVTARTLSTPLSLLAIAFVLRFEWSSRSRNSLADLGPCALCLVLAGAFHPLMTGYATAFVIVLLVAKLPSARARNTGWAALTTVAILASAALQVAAPAESAATVAAAYSRTYWFLSNWQWFERIGLAGPLLVLALIQFFKLIRPIGQPRPSAAPDPTTALCRAGLAIGLIALLISMLFAHQDINTHLVARLQPLRAFVLVYAVMVILLGATLADSFRSWVQRRIPPAGLPFAPAVPVLFLLLFAGIMYTAQRSIFPASQHIELPWRSPINPWVQAFVWIRLNTPKDAFFALDSDYITTHGEDAQTFRAFAQRSVLPDFSKDGGEASIQPRLASRWFEGQAAGRGLSSATPEDRAARLQPFGVSWVVLRADAATREPCPYVNAAVKVCRLPSAIEPGKR